MSWKPKTIYLSKATIDVLLFIQKCNILFITFLFTLCYLHFVIYTLLFTLCYLHFVIYTLLFTLCYSNDPLHFVQLLRMHAFHNDLAIHKTWLADFFYHFCQSSHSL